jgi:hypothetical protein
MARRIRSQLAMVLIIKIKAASLQGMKVSPF